MAWHGIVLISILFLALIDRYATCALYSIFQLISRKRHSTRNLREDPGSYQIAAHERKWGGEEGVEGIHIHAHIHIQKLRRKLKEKKRGTATIASPQVFPPPLFRPLHLDLETHFITSPRLQGSNICPTRYRQKYPAIPRYNLSPNSTQVV